MIIITLPDGSWRELPGPIMVTEVAQNIDADIAKATLAGRVDGQVVDTSYTIDRDTKLAIVTDKDVDGVDVIHYSTAHLLAYAIKELYPDTQVTIGPVIENDFYYDSAYKRPFTPDDLVAIEKKMGELAKKDEKVTCEVLSHDDTVKPFQGMGEKYKAEIITSIPGGQEIGLYREGNFVDLYHGPHVPSTGKLKVFKLMKAASTYWRDDHNSEMLQRIYGTAWARREDQDAYLHMLEGVEKRDRRKLGRELDLFRIDEYSPDAVFWHPKDWTLWQEIEQYTRRVYCENDCQGVKGPRILDKTLQEKTDHWGKYRENMFVTESEKREYALEPMNCPDHILIYKQGIKSYRDLLLRFDEFGACHRNEPSGGLHDIARMYGFTQDDGHVFCTEDMIQAEVTAFTTLLQKVYKDFGFTEIPCKLSTCPDKRIGTGKSQGHAEAALAEGLRAPGYESKYLPGGEAFYGPKIEYVLKDALGRQ